MPVEPAPKPITSLQNDRVKAIRALEMRKVRKETGLFVADARTGEALFAVNAEDPLNPASNVKMISTATAR